MTMAQMTFWSTLTVTSVVLTGVFYPGVRRQASSARDSALAATMAALLCGTGFALVVAFLVNVVHQWVNGPAPS